MGICYNDKKLSYKTLMEKKWKEKKTIEKMDPHLWFIMILLKCPSYPKQYIAQCKSCKIPLRFFTGVEGKKT